MQDETPDLVLDNPFSEFLEILGATIEKIPSITETNQLPDLLL
jgi:hypothetical protein